MLEKNAQTPDVLQNANPPPVKETAPDPEFLSSPDVMFGAETTPDQTTAPPKGVNDYFRIVMRVVAITMSLFHLYAAIIGGLPAMEQRSLHVGFALILIYMQSFLKAKNVFSRISSILFIGATVVFTLHAYSNWLPMAYRVAWPESFDIICGILLTLTVLEATRRRLGWIMPALAVIFILYAFVGPYLPAAISHRGYSLNRVISNIYMDLFGVYGQVIGISATYIFLFILFGAFLENSGAGKFFIDLSTGLVGKSKGGSAKVATVASCLFGMVSGSAVANVMTIGPLTIPLMQRSGYSNRFGGAITSVAGTGGQFMPPIMGSAAFIVAETLGIPYMQVAAAAFIPGLLYYLAIIFIIDFRSNKENMKGLETVPNVWQVLKKDFYLAVPVLLLVYGLAIAKWSPIKSGLYAIFAMFIVSLFRKDTRMTPKKLLRAFESAAMGSLEVASVCALAGIIIAMLSMTGLGLKFSGLLLTLSGGNMVVLLVLTMVAALILGMGMTTTSVYIILSVLVAPALIKMGVDPLAAHLFVFYFGILSAITPPVATASYAAAGVANDDPMKLGFAAWRIGLSGYLLPFLFVFSPELLMKGSPLAIILATISAIIGIYALSMALEGFFLQPINIFLRILLFAGALCLIYYGWVTDLIGLGILLLVILPQLIKSRKDPPQPAASTASS